MPHRGLEPASVLRLACQSDALPTELSLLSDFLHLFSFFGGYFFSKYPKWDSVKLSTFLIEKKERFRQRRLQMRDEYRLLEAK